MKDIIEYILKKFNQKVITNFINYPKEIVIFCNYCCIEIEFYDIL